jgi:hypothetical protein
MGKVTIKFWGGGHAQAYRGSIEVHLAAGVEKSHERSQSA